VKASRLSHWLRVCFLLVLCSLAAYACGGAHFSAGGSGGTGATDGGISGNSSAGTSAGKACKGPEDCDDKDPCTVDQCGPDGTCKRAPKCDVTQKCCDGACGECCSKADCDDGVACTDDDCSAGACIHAPNNVACGADQYCTVANGCRHKESCAGPTDLLSCDDKNTCTDDVCTNLLCDHTVTTCAKGELCCPGIGCAQCCEDSQCNDNDACTTDKCVSGQCSNTSLCQGSTAGAKCCASGDGTSTCGSCCSAADCDDGVDCTKDTCASGTCTHTDDSSACKAGFVCDAAKGCVQTAQCSSDGDCPSTDPCKTGSCVAGSCTFDTCVNGGTCCPGVGCRSCCGDAACDDLIACTSDSCSADGKCTHTPDNSVCGVGLTCDPAKGGCVQCTSDAQCNDNIGCTSDSCDLTSYKCIHKRGACCSDLDCQGGVIAAASPGPIGTKCPVPYCNTTTYTCSSKLVICSTGCCTDGCCGIQTQ